MGRYAHEFLPCDARPDLFANLKSGTTGDQATSERFVPGFAAVNRLLGKLYRASGDTKSAVDCQVLSLEANPFMWDSFTELCDTGRSWEALAFQGHNANW